MKAKLMAENASKLEWLVRGDLDDTSPDEALRNLEAMR